VTDKPRVRPDRRRLGPLSITVLMGMLALTAAVAVGVWHYQGGREQDARQAWAQRAVRDLGDQVSRTGAAVVGAKGLFESSESVENGAFARFAAVQLVHSNLLGLNWTPRVRAADRERFERDTGLRIVDRGPTGGFRPAGERAEYFPLRYLEPDTAGNRAALGLDVGIDGGTPAAFAAARDSGRLTMSSAIQLGASPTSPRGTALVSAVYRTDAPLETRAQRRAALRGFTSGAWRYDSLVAPVLEGLPAGARLEVTDGDEPVFGSRDRGRPGATEVATLGERAWTVRVSLPPGNARWAQLAAVLAGGLVLTVLVGLLLTEAGRRRREREAGRAELHHEANTDSLTGLGNRRSLRADFARVGPGATAQAPVGFMMFDLNGFKAYNDSFGHPAGDDLLARLGGRLAAAVPGGAAYRLGGDEFCTLVPVGAEGLDPLVTSALEALTEEGEGFGVSSAYGVVLLPRDARSLAEAMRLADQRMYQQKARGRASAGHQSADVLMKVLVERSPDLQEHLQGVSALAESVGRRMGLAQTPLSHLVRAAGLHDVGKVAIPESILTKPGPLDDREMTFIRRHTLIGARILLAAPSLAGEAIPLGARIIFACDAFEAMTSDERPYRTPVSAELALEELNRCAGTQFDPGVVAVLSEIVRAGAGADPLDDAVGTDPERRHPDTRGRPRRI
jgi:diguanylate cyclase (GGDEF)-like protein